MFTWTTYGAWLRGDARDWVSDGVIYPPDPVLESADRRRLRFAPFVFPRRSRGEAGELVGQAVKGLNGAVLALTVGSWHLHVVTAYIHVPIPTIVKTIKDCVRRGLGYGRPIWTAGYDKRFCFHPASLLARIRYVQKHNVQDGLPPNPWDFIASPPPVRDR